MTIESRVPLDHLKLALACYQRLYNCVHNPLSVYEYKTTIARKTFISLVVSVLKIIIFSMVISFAVKVSASNEDAAQFGLFVLVVIAIILGISIVLDFFYWQRVPGKRLKKIRFRYTYYIISFINDVRELSCFRKLFGVSTAAILLPFGFGKMEAQEKIKNWGYMVGEEYMEYINAYNEEYKNYREYVNLDDHWAICGDLLDIINSGRAVDVQGALSVLDTREHRARMEAYAAEQAAAAREAAREQAAAARAAEAAAASASEIATSVSDIAASEANQEYYLRQIRDKL